MFRSCSPEQLFKGHWPTNNFNTTNITFLHNAHLQYHYYPRYGISLRHNDVTLTIWLFTTSKFLLQNVLHLWHKSIHCSRISFVTVPQLSFEHFLNIHPVSFGPTTVALGTHPWSESNSYRLGSKIKTSKKPTLRPPHPFISYNDKHN